MELEAKCSKAELAARQIRGRIASGELRVGMRLESIRNLSEKLQLNRQTVFKAVELLAAEGLVKPHVGRGTFIVGTPRRERRLRLGVYMHLESPRSDAMSMFRALNQAALTRGHDLLFAERGNYYNLDAWMKDKDGVFVTGFLTEKLMKSLSGSGKPLMVFGNTSLKGDWPVIRLDFRSMLDRLFDASASIRSCARIGAILGNPSLAVSHEIADYLRECASERAIHVSEDAVFLEKKENGYAPMKQIMDMPVSKRPELLVVTAHAAEGVSKFLEEHRIARKDRPVIAVPSGISALNPELTFDVSILAGYRDMADGAMDWMESLTAKDGRYPETGCRLFESREFNTLIHQIT